MKPSLLNLARTLIGKSAISSIYTTNFNEDRAFVITDVKITRGMVSVKGDKTPWLTENVVEVLGIGYKDYKSDISKEELLEVIDKLKPATKTGIVQSDDFDKIRDRILAKTDTHPIGSWYCVKTSDTDCFFMVKVKNDWMMCTNVKELSYFNNKQTDLLRHLFTLTYSSYSPTACLDTDTDNMKLLKEVRAYFFCPLSYYGVNIEEVVAYLNKYTSVGSKKIPTIAKFIMSEDIFIDFSKVCNELYKDDVSKMLKKDIKAKFTDIGFNGVMADFATSLIKG